MWIFDQAQSISADFTTAQWLFIKGVALCYLVAFTSLIPQIKGLFGQRGISPIAGLVESVRYRLGSRPWLRVPTLFWWKSSDQALMSVALVGWMASLAVILGAPASLLLFVCWICYISFVTVGSLFMSYQWDSLLLEIGFISIFYGLSSPPLLLWHGVLWFVLFRFMFSSGMVKIVRNCPKWNTFTAMDYHYETQPLPSRLAWYFHKQPKWLSKLSVGVTFFIEIVVPFFIFMPAPVRLVVVASFLALQMLIVVTGSYTFFNLLSFVMCLPLLPNEYLDSMVGHHELFMNFSYSGYLELALAPVALVWVFMNIVVLLELFFSVEPYRTWMSHLNYYMFCSPYGLFAHMTTIRDEIIVEGSDNGELWLPYEFKYKPGNPMRPPKYAAPHQPRLDWQLWFAALGSYHTNGWFLNFVQRLLEGSPQVLHLIEKNPFPNKPPRFIRANRWRYHFSDWKTRKKSGRWWTRRFIGPYTPPVSLENFQKG